MEEKVEKAAEAGETKQMARIKSKHKVIRKRKSRKEKEDPLSGAIRLAVEGGRVGFGSRKGIKDLLLGSAKLVVIASNVPPSLAEDVKRYGEFSGIPLVEFGGTSIQLGSICGKPFPVSVLAVYEEGASNILDFGKKKK